MSIKLQMKQEMYEENNLREDKSCIITVNLSEEMYDKIKRIAGLEKTTISYETKLIIIKFVASYNQFHTSLNVKTGEELKNLRFGNRKRFGVKINKYYNDRLKEIAYLNRTSISEVVRALLDEYIEEYEKDIRAKDENYSHSLIEEKPFEMYIDLA